MKTLILFLLLALGLFSRPVSAQTQPNGLTLDEVIAQALNHSAVGQQAFTTRETSYWSWRGYQANYRPQLGLQGTLPNFRRVITPVVQPDGISLKHYELLVDTPLRNNRWGIPEPVPTAATEVPAAAFDAVLVPLLAVDETGHRVGYGGGFYDRFLAQCRPDAQFIGISVLDDAPVAPLADVLPTDVPLHACLLPNRIWQF